MTKEERSPIRFGQFIVFVLAWALGTMTPFLPVLAIGAGEGDYASLAMVLFEPAAARWLERG